jgi:hypothetical protein
VFDGYWFLTITRWVGYHKKFLNLNPLIINIDVKIIPSLVNFFEPIIINYPQGLILKYFIENCLLYISYMIKKIMHVIQNYMIIVCKFFL